MFMGAIIVSRWPIMDAMDQTTGQPFSTGNWQTAPTIILLDQQIHTDARAAPLSVMV